MNFASTLIATLLLTTTTALAEDGRTGPVTFNDAALNTALANLNGFLQARYVVDDAMQLIVEDTQASTYTTYDTKGASIGFGPEISDGSSLGAHLVALNEELSRTSLVVVIQTMMNDQSETVSDFGPVISGNDSLEASVAALEPKGRGALPVFSIIGEAASGSAESEFGPRIAGDADLKKHLATLSASISDNEEQTNYVTGTSFEAYAATLRLY